MSENAIRAYDTRDDLDADVVDGMDANATIERLFADPNVTYLHVHDPKRGCYAARVARLASLPPLWAA